MDWANFLSMSEPINIETIRAGLRRVMARKGVKPTTLSLRVGNNRTLVKDLLEKTNDVSLSTLSKLADALEVEIADLLTADEPAEPFPNAAELAEMLHNAMMELPPGVSYAEFPHAVSSSLYDQLELFRAVGASRRIADEEIAPGTDAQSRVPTKESEREGLHTQ